MEQNINHPPHCLDLDDTHFVPGKQDFCIASTV